MCVWSVRARRVDGRPKLIEPGQSTPPKLVSLSLAPFTFISPPSLPSPTILQCEPLYAHTLRPFPLCVQCPTTNFFFHPLHSTPLLSLCQCCPPFSLIFVCFAPPSFIMMRACVQTNRTLVSDNSRTNFVKKANLH